MKAPAFVKRLQHLLRQDMHPETLGTFLGAGLQAQAWRIKDYVVKSPSFTSSSRDRARRVYAKHGIKLAPSWRAGTWRIQPYYEPLGLKAYDQYPTLQNELRVDFHGNNVGSDKRGRVWAFDW